MATKKRADETVNLGPPVKVVSVDRGPGGWRGRVARIPAAVFEQYQEQGAGHPHDLKGIAHEKAVVALFGNTHGLIE